jgi:hypothetical protein
VVRGVEEKIDSACQTNPTSAACQKSVIDQIVPVVPPPPNPNPPLITGSGYHVSYAFGGKDLSGAPVSGNNKSAAGTVATFDPTGQLTKFTGFPSATFTGAHQEFGTAAGVVAWGRWTGAVAGSDVVISALNLNMGSNEGYHYVVGMPATAMPTAAGVIPFSFVGATNPTGSDGTLSPGTFSGTMSVDFSAGTVNLAAALAFAGFTYNLSGPASFSRGLTTFTGTMNGASPTGAPGAYACSGSCNAAVNGAFFGAGATHAGYAYQVTTLGATVSGTAVFKQ